MSGGFETEVRRSSIHNIQTSWDSSSAPIIKQKTKRSKKKKQKFKINDKNMDDIRHLFTDMDKDNDNKLNFEEFKNGCNAKLGETFPETTLRTLYDTFDQDEDGSIELDEFVQHLGRTLNVCKTSRESPPEVLFASTIRILLQVRERKQLRKELQEYTGRNMINRTEFNKLLQKFEVELEYAKENDIFNYFDVDTTNEISLANLEHFMRQFEECQTEQMTLKQVFERAIQEIDDWKNRSQYNITTQRGDYKPICYELMRMEVWGCLIEPIAVLAHFFIIFGGEPGGDTANFQMIWLLGFIRCGITFGVWFYSIKIPTYYEKPKWLMKAFVALWVYALTFAIISTIFYSQSTYEGGLFDCYTCPRCSKNGFNYEDPICWGDVTAFSGEDDTCVCSLSPSGQVGVDPPERTQECIIGNNCVPDYTCTDIYLSVTPQTPNETWVYLPANREGYIVSDFHEDTWTFDVFVNTTDIMGELTYEISEMKLMSLEYSLIEGDSSCFIYDKGWFFQSGTWLIIMVWAATLALSYYGIVGVKSMMNC